MDGLEVWPTLGREGQVDCFYCDFSPPTGDPLEHLAREHADRVNSELDETTRRLRIRILCPYCPFSLRSEIGTHSDMHPMEITLPAFTMLFYHLANDHEPPLTEERLVRQSNVHPTG